VKLGRVTEEYNIFDHTVSSDLLKYGLIPELIGRMPVLCTLHELSEEALVDILTQPKNAICSQYKKYFQMDGVDLEFDHEALREIASIAIKQKAGARGLRAIMEKFMLKIMYDIPDMEKLRGCRISADVVSKGSAPEFTFAGSTARRKAVGSS